MDTTFAAPPAQPLFGTAAPDLAAGSRTVATGAAISLLAEIEKAIARRLGAGRTRRLR